jgi:hypothetical protein
MSDYPTSRPRLVLDFANSKKLDRRITFRRSSSGTYVGADGLIKTANIDQPRFDHDPVTGQSLGLLVEESRTNSWTYSEQLENAAWTKTDTTVTANSATAPDGTTTASKITSTATTAVHSISRLKTVVSPAWVTVYLKAAEYTICDVYDVNIDTGFRINLLTGALSESPAFVGKFISGRYGISSAGNGWFRVQLGLATSDATVNNPVRIYPNGAQSYLGDGTSGILVWGAQLEAGAFPTSYIPTAGSTVTRSADLASITGTNFSSWYNFNEGSLCVETPQGLVLPTSANTTVLGFSAGTLSASLSTGDGIKYGSGNTGTNTRVQIITNSSTVFDNGSSTNARKVLISYKKDNFAIARNGVLGVDNSGDVPLTVDRFTLRAGGATSYSRILYWPKRLPDSQLIALTRR